MGEWFEWSSSKTPVDLIIRIVTVGRYHKFQKADRQNK